jgi:hypothetical protein
MTGCGIKGDPITPKGAVSPSFLEDYEDINLEKAQQVKVIP